MKPETVITYIDIFGKEHNALLVSQNQMDERYANLVYLGPDGKPVSMISIAHADHPSNDENNPALGRVVLNAWREVIDVDAMSYQVAQDQEKRLVEENLALKAQLADTTEGRDKALQELADSRAAVPATETRHYADGSSATGPGPLPDHSPNGAPEVPAPQPDDNGGTIHVTPPIKDGAPVSE